MKLSASFHFYHTWSPERKHFNREEKNPQFVKQQIQIQINGNTCNTVHTVPYCAVPWDLTQPTLCSLLSAI